MGTLHCGTTLFRRRVSTTCTRLSFFVALFMNTNRCHSVQAFAPPNTVSLQGGLWTQNQKFGNSLLLTSEIAVPTLITTRVSSSTRPLQALSFASFRSSVVSPSARFSIDTIEVVAAIFLLSFYHIQLYHKEKTGQPTWRSTQADTREAWARYVRSEEAWLYAIQTLRNAITAQTFLATTVLSLLTVISGRLWTTQSSTTTTTSTAAAAAAAAAATASSSSSSTIQFVLAAASMVSSAYQFLQSARLMTHAGFMFPVTKTTTEVDRIMRRSQHSQWMGLRCLYSAAGFLSWIMGGPRVFLVASILLTVFFRKIDQVPTEIDS